ncbi:MAG TPA: hypothetical protein VMB81_07545 [Candidatus Sulfotelmatobacter sp.]|nr:hypothetical protein [Candidatus Sulfotelmatobacter sp.]
MLPSPYWIDRSWYQEYWLAERPPLRPALTAAPQHIGRVLTGSHAAPHREADAPVLACQTQPDSLPLPPI